ncbi:hypothetical protein EOPP23_00045 [Endozoicomonas sp. OPT23]|uniref:DISARM system phospholipase D-like protein DrmC n=1 Tax=Endozoicomonas sp. OPT23 TaxID=2072845 RepID=UPI00129BFA68|nr:DISARM system phospholipase D-like protein DrmC [Endozoicomonas sp. OPT23]MRI31378.1 hypothetical protein [Endozoicomonas sp. OPT23]
MEELLEAVGKFVEMTHPDKVRQFASVLKGMSTPINKKTLATKVKTTPQSANHLKRLLALWNEDHVELLELAGMLQGVNYKAHHSPNNEQIELVWTGPDSTVVPVRKTSAVLCEVIDKAKRTLFISSYVINDINDVALAIDVAIKRGVKVSFLAESSESRGGSIKNYDPGERIAARLPSASVYYWPQKSRTNTTNGNHASMHAKCIVADDEISFITSANLTGHALEHNIEMGVLIYGGKLPKIIHKHWEMLIITNIIEKI